MLRSLLSPQTSHILQITTLYRICAREIGLVYATVLIAECYEGLKKLCKIIQVKECEIRVGPHVFILSL